MKFEGEKTFLVPFDRLLVVVGAEIEGRSGWAWPTQSDDISSQGDFARKSSRC